MTSKEINLSSELKKINEELKLTSERASEREGGPTGCQADKLNAVNSARFVESAQSYEGRKPKKAR